MSRRAIGVTRLERDDDATPEHKTREETNRMYCRPSSPRPARRASVWWRRARGTRAQHTGARGGGGGGPTRWSWRRRDKIVSLVSSPRLQSCLISANARPRRASSAGTSRRGSSRATPSSTLRARCSRTRRTRGQSVVTTCHVRMGRLALRGRTRRGYEKNPRCLFET